MRAYLVDAAHNPQKKTLVNGLGKSFDGEVDLLLVLLLDDKITASLHLWLEQSTGKVTVVDAEEMSNLLGS